MSLPSDVIVSPLPLYLVTSDVMSGGLYGNSPLSSVMLMIHMACREVMPCTRANGMIVLV